MVAASVRPDERTASPSRRRHLFINQLDGPEREGAVDAADAAAEDRELLLYGDRAFDGHLGWSREP